jgi:ABC-type polysaccharide/polyol phosphate transport system ATPase subunit
MSSDAAAVPSAIAVAGLGKRYRLQHQGQKTLKAAALSLLGRRAPREEFWAVRRVSFAVRRGETLGVIGRNGAGKSTLLGLIAGTITPSEGSVETSGRISSLLELGAGFHPDLTGRENVFLNGSILGLRRREIDERMGAIIAFAELERFIDTPVKHYSSGMFVRLAFSVAMEVDPEILIVDEVLSVGDERFREKCRDRIEGFKGRGRTLLIVSHEMDTIQTMCDRVLVLDHGETVMVDTPGRAVHEYRMLNVHGDGGPEVRESGTREAEIVGVDLLTPAGEPLGQLAASDGLRVRLRYRTRHRIPEPVFGLALSDGQGRVLFGTNTEIDGFTLPGIDGDGAVEIAFAPLPLQRGRFYFTFAIHSRDHRVFHRLDNRYAVVVAPTGEQEGIVRLQARWSAAG